MISSRCTIAPTITPAGSPTSLRVLPARRERGGTTISSVSASLSGISKIDTMRPLRTYFKMTFAVASRGLMAASIPRWGRSCWMEGRLISAMTFLAPCSLARSAARMLVASSSVTATTASMPDTPSSRRARTSVPSPRRIRVFSRTRDSSSQRRWDFSISFTLKWSRSRSRAMR